MKVLLAGAFGNLGFEILKVLVERGHDVVAADLKEKENNGLEGRYTFKAINATDPETLKGICDGVEVVITTMGLTSASTVVSLSSQRKTGILKRLRSSSRNSRVLRALSPCVPSILSGRPRTQASAS